MRFAKKLTQAIVVFRYYNEVYVIRHKTISQDLYPGSGFGLDQQFEVPAIVGFVIKSCLPSIVP